MLNREIYSKDPVTRKLVNEGVASVNDEKTKQALDVLRYELETFVCDGQYAKGLEHILETYLKNINQAQQPAVWVSGFYGSGKSHLVKMLRALWIDTGFDDNATARGIANLPQNIKTLLVELSTQGKRHGGLHAASGTLGAGASGSVRLALMRIIFKSIGLPEQYPVARFVMWLRDEGIYEELKKRVEEKKANWQEELDNFHVAEDLHAELTKLKPNLFSSTADCNTALNNQFPNVQDVSSDDMIKVIRQTLTKDGKLPLTLVVLDEVQQYIGEDTQRSIEVQEIVEACCKNIGGKLLFIGTGQTAVTGTSNLKKLEGRFTVRIELSDTDVDAVIRKVILAKKPDSINSIEQVMQTNLGEISRHLSNTNIGHRQEDIKYFVSDYPLLPVRRRFWENMLRVLDQTGTDSQLRNQLSMVHKVIQTNMTEPLGHVVPADYLYFDSADKLLQARILPRKVHEKTMSWIKGSEDERLTARACGLVFLVTKLTGSNNEIGIRATVDTIADLMVENLSCGSGALRGRLPKLLDSCKLLMKIGDEYRIQTEESAAWNDDFLSQRSQLANETYRIEAERDERVRLKFKELAGKLSLIQGNSKVSRDLYPVFDEKLPVDSDKKVCIWIKDGWSIDENSVRVNARQAGNRSPAIFVFIPKSRNADDLRHYLIEYKAAAMTLEKRGVPNTPEGTEARAVMETIKQTAERRIKEFLEEVFSEARVFQGGGTEISGNNLQEMILEAAGNSLQRLYPQFHVADHAGWEKAYSRAKQGAPDALKTVGYDGEPAQHPVCKAILAFLPGGKKGADIRNHFEGSLYGWPQDAVDGGLQALLIAGLIQAQDERWQPVDSRELERKLIGKTNFKLEAAVVTASHRIKVRGLLQKLNCQAKQGEELSAIPDFLRKMQELADCAGGEPPKPQRSDTSALDEIRRTAGNEQIIALYNRHEELVQQIDTWNELAKQIQQRWPVWLGLQNLLQNAGDIKTAQDIRQQSEAILNQRLLLKDPDPIQPLLKSLEDGLRKELNTCRSRYSDEFATRQMQLDNDASWRELTEDERGEILHECEISAAPDFSVGNYEELVRTLERYPINGWNDRIDALSNRFARARELAARSLEPEMQTVDIPHRTIKTEADIETWLKEVEVRLKSALAKGPIIIR